MRHITRDWDLAPDYLTSAETVAAVQEFGAFLEEGGASAKQAYLEVDAGEILRRGADELLRACRTQFSGKCAFTEMDLSEQQSPWMIHLLRPDQGARDDRGEVASERHYWWLVNDWENFYLAMSDIASIKGQVFPVVGERMAGPGAPPDHGLLLDPCRDFPEWYLRFGRSGGVAPAWLPLAVSGSDMGLNEDYEQLMEANQRRASASIRLFGLDLDHVRLSRQSALQSFALATDAGEIDPESAQLEIETALELLEESTPHIGAIRQVLAQKVLLLTRHPGAEILRALRPELGAAAWMQPGAANTLVELLGQEAHDILAVGGEVFPELLGLAGPVGAEEYGTLRPVGEPLEMSPDPELAAIAPQTMRPKIKRVTITDFKAITRLEVAIDDEEMRLSEPNRYQRLYEDMAAQGGGKVAVADYAKPVVQTRVFIGENGSGKSSILQAIALVLASDRERELIGEELKDFIRWDITDDGPRPNPEREAIVTVEMLTATFTLTIKPDGTVLHEAVDQSGNLIDTTGSSPWFLMRAYSATRTLKGEDSSREPLSIRNLFDPRVPLVKPEAWLLSLDKTQFGLVAATLHQLFNESPAEATNLSTHSLMARVPAENPTKVVVGNVELRHLSDGYRAVITLFCDIMAAAQSLNPTDMRLAEGIVLIDEIGAHLHPRWRTRISSLIRREFASMQIIVSTHEPLCMRGFMGGEVILVERATAGQDEHEAIELDPDDDMFDPDAFDPSEGQAESDEPDGVRLTVIKRNPTGLRVDQLLTSEFFGLHTTLDPEENDRLHLYYQLRAKQAKPAGLADWELELLDRVRPVETEQVFGFSYREQLTYEAIDQYLTERQSRISPAKERARRDQAFREVAEIWRAFELELDDGDGP